MTHKIKICLVAHLFPSHEQDHKGIFVRDLALELFRRGYEVHVVTPMRPSAVKEESCDGVYVHRFPFLGWHRGIQLGELKGTPILLLGSLIISGIIKCIQSVLKYRIDLIHAYWVVPGGFIGMVAGKLTGLPVVATAAGSDLNLASGRSFVRQLIRLTLKSLDRLVAVSTPLSRIALNLGLSRDKCVIIPGPVGIDILESTPGKVKLATKKKYPQCLLYVGNLTPPRRIDTVIRAMLRVRETSPDCHLVIVGDGILRQPSELLAEELDIRPNIHFLGARAHDQVLELLRSADVFIHCSNQEGLPVAIMEAMGASLPVVAGRVGGVPELVREGETGFMVSPDDVEGYAKKTLRLLNDDQLRKTLGVNGRRYAERHLNKTAIFSQLEIVYKEELTSRQSKGFH